MKITILGLGPGPYDLLTDKARRLLEQAPQVWLRTARHPTVLQFPASVRWNSLDYVYDRVQSFESLYQELAAEVIAIAERDGQILYAVPGDPSMAEDSVHEILRMAGERENLDVTVVPGVSFVEVSMSASRSTMGSGLQLLEASRVGAANPLIDLLVYQIEDRLVASDVKLELLRLYPAEHVVTLVQGDGTSGDQDVVQLPLHELDRRSSVDHLTALYVPSTVPERAFGSFDAFAQIVARLRAPDGCPWDRDQTHASLKPYVVEEAYEVVEAIDRGDPAMLSEELGDLLLQVLLHSEIASEADEFDINDVIAGVAAKMVRRHPHVFGDVSVSGAQEVLVNWESIKKAERAEQDEKKTMFSGIPIHMPALQAAQEIQGRAARVGFDWKEIKGVLEKVAEEVGELSRASDAAELQAEFGDVLFALVNTARHLGVNAEMSLRDSNRKFVDRFTRMEQMAHEQGVDFASLDLEDQDALWTRAKADERDMASE
jgi:tetrapyrrole methylase family protein / MazG family protein